MKMKKILMGLMLVMVLSVLFCFSVEAEGNYTEGDITYELFHDSKTAAVVKYNGASETVTVPEKVADEYTVTAISGGAFNGEKGVYLKTIDLPESLVEIGEAAFASCVSLENIVIPSSVKTLGRYMFINCYSLKRAEIRASITRLPEVFFGECFNLENVVLSETINTIGEDAFAGCISLKDFSCGENIIRLEDDALCCVGMNSIVVKNRNMEIGEMAIGYTISKEYIDYIKRYVDILILFNIDESSITEEQKKEVNEMQDTVSNAVPIVDENYTIYGYTGSTAEAYANDNGIKFVALDGECPHTGGTASCVNRAVCTLCGEEYGELAEHTPSVITMPSSCTAAGYTLTICSVCGDTISYELGTVLGHDMTGVTNNENGTHTIYCKRSDCSGTETKDCSFADWNVTTQATCEGKGYRERTCSVCMYTQGEEISANGHSEGKVTKENVVHATCEKDGSYDEVVKCTVCTKELSRKTVVKNKLGHDMGQWNVTKSANLLEEGSRTRKCSRCPKTETETIEKLPANTTKDDNTYIEIKYPDSAYGGKEMEVRVEEDYTGAQYLAQSLGVEYIGTMSFNIKTYVDGKEVQPTEAVLVRIPLPTGFNSNKVAIYHINTKTGVFERITPVYIKDGYIEFLATSFSIYTAVDESTEIITDPETPDAPTDDDCSCKCHKTGLIGIIWKILRFFYKIFGINKACACGIAHY